VVDAGAEALTDREREVLDLMAEGLTNSGIAKRLYLSAEAVRGRAR
jgi:DNA-binding NarL/FixJ family response regulator